VSAENLLQFPWQVEQKLPFLFSGNDNSIVLGTYIRIYIFMTLKPGRKTPFFAFFLENNKVLPLY